MPSTADLLSLKYQKCSSSSNLSRGIAELNMGMTILGSVHQ